MKGRGDLKVKDFYSNVETNTYRYEREREEIDDELLMITAITRTPHAFKNAGSVMYNRTT